MKIKDITNYLEQWAPTAYQESYDNSGLLVGDSSAEVLKVLITLDVTEEVIEESIQQGCNLIVAHHPLIFNGVKQITGSHWVERCLIKAIKNDIGIYAIHTNLDNVHTGVNKKIADQIGLQHLSILSPKKQQLSKLVTFVPTVHLSEVLDALYTAGAGQVGKYDHCSFQVDGTGTFRPGEGTQPHIGSKGQDESVAETRIEVLLPHHKRNAVIAALHEKHPYEEVAYYLSNLENTNQEVGSGMMGILPNPMEAEAFLKHLKQAMGLNIIRHTKICVDPIRKVALCGGSGSFLLGLAKAKGAEVFVTGDFKYHDFFEAEDQLIIADIGHYESEVFTKELIGEKLKEKFANIAFRLSEVDTNPITYL
ncbi:MAG: Nif3-like dinuclear metal center hexameric protein [Cyclobacteriaceae bacterium]|nr:Nif3-like dinuclear metal center hexameric protein [Cyclobacteriaceae bacterium HetDA_MAG_MS6]